jgi:hypothetical protein
LVGEDLDVIDSARKAEREVRETIAVEITGRSDIDLGIDRERGAQREAAIAEIGPDCAGLGRRRETEQVERAVPIEIAGGQDAAAIQIAGEIRHVVGRESAQGPSPARAWNRRGAVVRAVPNGVAGERCDVLVDDAGIRADAGASVDLVRGRRSAGK